MLMPIVICRWTYQHVDRDRRINLSLRRCNYEDAYNDM